MENLTIDQIPAKVQECINNELIFRQRREWQAFTTRCLLEGNYWISFNYYNNSLVSRVNPLNQSQVAIVNGGRVILRGITNMAVKNDPRITVAIRDDSPEAEIIAAKRLLMQANEEGNYSKSVELWMKYAFTGGVAYIIPHFETANNRFEFEVVDFFDGFPNVPLSQFEKCSRFIVSDNISKYDMENMEVYKKKNKYKDNYEEALKGFGGITQLYDSNFKSLFSSYVYNITSFPDLARRHKCYYHKKKGNKTVTICQHIVSGKVIYEREYKFTIPELIVPYIPEMGISEYYPRAWFTDLQTFERAITKLYTSMLDYIQVMQKGRYLIPKGGKLQKSYDDDMHGEVLEYAQGYKPENWAVPPLPPDYYNTEALSEKFKMDIGGIHSESMGRAKDVDASGRSIIAQQAADENNIAGCIRNLSESLSRLGESILKIASSELKSTKTLVSMNEEEKEIRVIGEEEYKNMTEVEQETRVPIRNLARVKVKVVPGTVMNDYQIREDAKELLTIFANDPNFPKDEILEALVNTYDSQELVLKIRKSMEKNEEGRNPDVQLAEAQNDKMIRGERVQASPTDDARIHLPIHTALYKHPNLAPELRQIVTEHIQQDLQLLQAQQGGIPQGELPQGEMIPQNETGEVQEEVTVEQEQ